MNYCTKANEHNRILKNKHVYSHLLMKFKNSLDKFHAFEKPFKTFDYYDFSTHYTSLPN